MHLIVKIPVKDELLLEALRGMRPTPRANELSSPIQKALSELELSLSSINFNPRTTNKLYKISISDDVAPLILPNLINFFGKTITKLLS